LSINPIEKGRIQDARPVGENAMVKLLALGLIGFFAQLIDRTGRSGTPTLMFAVTGTIDSAMGLESSRLRLRVQVIAAGVWVTYLFAVALAVWLAATWNRPHRGALIVLILVALLGAFVVSRLPAETIVRSRFREAFFLSWSLLDIAVICLLAYFDGGVTSPITLSLFLTQVFAALSYPLASMIAVAAASLLGVAVLGVMGSGTLAHPQADPVYMAMFLVCLSLTGVLCVWQSRLTERQREELSELSRTDPLTGCLNRRGFSERLDAELARAEREGGEVALIQLDLNGFKAVNDVHGHAAGDELLRWVGSTLQALLRESDATGRLGGDEFALLLPGVGAAEARVIADRTVAALAERIGAAAGVACHPPDGPDGDTLHRHADADLYAVKAHLRS
jgi:diguanylate cyclase (GGDEF)-like protein